MAQKLTDIESEKYWRRYWVKLIICGPETETGNENKKWKHLLSWLTETVTDRHCTTEMENHDFWQENWLLEMDMQNSDCIRYLSLVFIICFQRESTRE